jgi:energy-coupling factor transport system ATP-binding protein
MKALRRLKDELGITIILVTHFMDEAVNADRVIVMNDGKIALDGTPADVFSNSELLADIGLSVPKALELAVELRKNNIDIGGIPLTSDDFIKEYKKILQRG